MPKTLDEIKAALEAAKLESLFDDIVQNVEAERQRGISEKRKANKEVEALKKYKAVVDALELDPDDAEAVPAIKEKLAGKTAPDGQVEKLLKEMAKLKQTVLEAETKAQQSDARRKTMVIKAKLESALAEKLHAHDLVAKDLIESGRVKLLDDERTVVFVDNDDEIDFDKGLASVLDERKILVKNTQKPGTGTPPGKSTPPVRGAGEPTTLEMLRMSN